ncbi:reverse transcriptase domain-containing protein [Tanacetum coccineum]
MHRSLDRQEAKKLPIQVKRIPKPRYDTWTFTDGAVSEKGIVLKSPDDREHTYGLRLGFDASNNEAEYEAVLARLKLVRTMEANAILEENHDGVCGMHSYSTGVAVAGNAITTGQQYTTMALHKWGIDICGPLITTSGNVKFLVVAVDYFIKWIKAKPMATITR